MTGRFSLIAGLVVLSFIVGCGGEAVVDPADLEPVLSPGFEVVKLAGGFAFTEGPAADKAGNVYFTDIPNNKIHTWSLDGELGVFKVNTGGANGLFFGNPGQLWIQFLSVLATMVFAFVMTLIILKFVDTLVGLRVSEEEEERGLDISLHNEAGYSF